MSLRARLIAGMVVVVIALAAAGWFTVTSTQGHLLDQVDDQLLGLGGVGRIRFGAGDAAPLPPGDDVEPPAVEDGTERPPTPVWVGLVTTDGAVETVFRPSFDDGQPDPDTEEVAAALAESDVLFTVDSDPAGVRYRVRVVSSPFDEGVRLVGLSLEHVDAATARLAVVVAAVTSGAALVLGFVIWTVLRLGVVPLRRMTEAASVIADGDLSHRVDHGDSSTEADQLGAALNRMMTTIEEAFEAKDETEQRLRRFVADASHELRTPTSTIRGYAELYRLGGLSEPEAMADAMRRTELEAARLGRLVEDLLLLARTDQGRPLDSEPVDLASVATEVVGNARVAHRDRSIGLTVPDGAVVLGDGDRLRQVVGNLVDNAIQHTPESASVDVAVRTDDGHVVVEVSDDGPGIPPHVGAQVFARFWRADESRTRASGGSGLGLSIVQSIVEAHGGDVTMTSQPGAGATFAVRLRQAPAAARSHRARGPVLDLPMG